MHAGRRRACWRKHGGSVQVRIASQAKALDPVQLEAGRATGARKARQLALFA